MTPRPPDSSSANRHTYIPASAQQAMSQHMQQAVPAHLRQYVGNQSGYVPQHVQKELTSFMQKSMPAHLQQYAGAYVQQKVVDPSLLSHGVPRPAVAPPPTPRRGDMTHRSDISSQQPDAQFLNLFQADAAPGLPAQPMMTKPGENYPPTNQPQQPAEYQYPSNQLPEQQYNFPNANQDVSQQPYDFIMNPTAPKRKAPLGGGKSARLAVMAGVGVVVLIAVIVVGSILNRPSFSTTQMVAIAEEQNELIRIAGLGAHNAQDQNALNSAFNIQLSVQSAQAQLISYLAKNHVKIDQKTLELKHNSQTDAQLNAAQAASVYDSEFLSIAQTQLAAYQQALKAAYGAKPGPVGEKLLSQEYTSAGLLLEQSQQT